MTTDFIKSIIVDFWGTVAEMSPYLLFGFFAAGLLSVVISQRLVEKHLGGTGLWPLVKASLFGVPLPLCSCSVIPVSMSLHKHGAAKGPTLSFLLSTPQTGVDSILVTLSLLGPLFAVFRPLAAFITGIIGGGLVNLFDPLETTVQEKSGPENCPHCRSDNKILTGLKYGFVTLPRDIGKAMLLGLLVAAFISAVVPEGYFAEKLGTGIVPMLVMMALGIPVYVCATASVPVAAALILKGISPGAALVFLMTGPATNAATFATIWKVLGRTTAVIYLATVAGCALAAGLILDYFAAGVDLNIGTFSAWMLPTWVKYVSAFALLALLAPAVFKKSAPRHKT